MNPKKRIVVLGGGAAGFFAALHAAANEPDAEVILFEKTTKVLSKVKVSGGGRCNVTYACFDIQNLAKHYPRGSKQLLQAFHQFSPSDTVNWFESKGVKLKTEVDGRMFPESNSSQTIIDCLMHEAEKNKVRIWFQTKVNGIQKTDNHFILKLENHSDLLCSKLIVAVGGSSKIQDYQWLQELGHTIVAPVPSLFTFNIPNSPLSELMGLSVAKTKVSVSGTKLMQEGPLLITHWGFSGPAILKLSAWGAQILNDKKYAFEIRINWLPQFNFETLQQELNQIKIVQAKQQLSSRPWNEIPKRLWEYFLSKGNLNETQKWAEISNKQLNKLAEILCNDCYQANGKTTFKEEFVTCGGVNLDEVDFKTMQSKKCTNLFFAGEVLNLDGITGGFNFQAAWTTAFIAAKA
jgi:predicted Rossmann fold flavoprotein